MSRIRTTLPVAAALLLAPSAGARAQDFQNLSIVRIDPASADPGERRRLTVQIRADRHLETTQEHPVVKNGQEQWETHVMGSSALTKRRFEELSVQVRDALAARPAGDLSGALPAEQRQKARRYEVAIDGTRFQLCEGHFASPAIQAKVEPLLQTLDALIEKELPPPPLYVKIRYRRGGQTLELNPSGTWSLETPGAPFQFGTFGAGPLKKIDALARAAGPFVPQNRGRSLAVPAAPAAAGEAFELELELRGGGEPVELTGKVGAYAASAARTGELVDYLDATIKRVARDRTAGVNGALDPN